LSNENYSKRYAYIVGEEADFLLIFKFREGSRCLAKRSNALLKYVSAISLEIQ